MMLLGDKKGRKTLLYIVCMALVIALLPFILVLGLFGWMAAGGIGDLITPESVYAELPAEVQVEVVKYEGQMSQIEQVFSDEGLSSADISKAKTLYVSALVGKESSESFYTDYADCFKGADSNATLLSNISSAFGVTFTDVDRQEFEKLYGGSG